MYLSNKDMTNCKTENNTRTTFVTQHLETDNLGKIT